MANPPGLMDFNTWWQQASAGHPDWNINDPENRAQYNQYVYTAQHPGSGGAFGNDSTNYSNQGDSTGMRAYKGGQDEDYARVSEAQLQSWEPYKDSNCPPNAPYQAFDGSGCVQKPIESANAGGGGGGGGNGGGGGGGGSYGQAGGVPQFNFNAPTMEDLQNDPGYQAELNSGLNAIQHSAAAKGMLRTGNTVAGLAGYANQFTRDAYRDLYDRQYTYAKDQFAPQYGGWQTMYQGDLSKWTTNQNSALQKYLQREGNLYGIIMGGQPTYNTGISGGGYGY